MAGPPLGPWPWSSLLTVSIAAHGAVALAADGLCQALEIHFGHPYYRSGYERKYHAGYNACRTVRFGLVGATVGGPLAVVRLAAFQFTGKAGALRYALDIVLFTPLTVAAVLVLNEYLKPGAPMVARRLGTAGGWAMVAAYGGKVSLSLAFLATPPGFARYALATICGLVVYATFSSLLYLPLDPLPGLTEEPEGPPSARSSRRSLPPAAGDGSPLGADAASSSSSTIDLPKQASGVDPSTS